MNNSDETIKAKPQDNTDDIIAAIRRIMEAEDAILKDDPDTKLMSLEAQKRIYAALDRLTGGHAQPPTVLEALILEALQPLLGTGWMPICRKWSSGWCARKFVRFWRAAKSKSANQRPYRRRLDETGGIV